jgi:hypothetical protein
MSGARTSAPAIKRDAMDATRIIPPFTISIRSKTPPAGNP